MRVVCDQCRSHGAKCERCNGWVGDGEELCPSCEAWQAVDTVADQLQGTIASLAAVRLVIDSRRR